MSEIYEGIKFKFIQRSDIPPDHPLLYELIYWCKVFHERNFAPPYPGGSSGNLSFRTDSDRNSFIISCSRTALSESMNSGDFSQVTECNPNKNSIIANGLKAPSSESFMHYMIYSEYKEINAVFHGHSDEIMQKAIQLGFPETEKELEYGTTEFAQDASKLIKYGNFVVLKNHGFVSTGKTMKEAGEKVLQISKK